MDENQNMEKIWNGVMAAIKISVSPATFSTFFKSTVLIKIETSGDRLVCSISCPSTMIRDTLDYRYKGQISDELSRLLGKASEIRWLINQNKEVENNDGKTDKNKPVELPLFQKKEINIDDVKRARLKDEYTFEDYAVGGSNQIAYAAASAVAAKPGKTYNPLFIWGGVGVGKTHLMQAAGREIIGKGEDRVLFCTSEQFTNDLVEGIRNKTTEKVRSKYRKLKLLMIDDVQFMAGKGSAQEEFFHTFNEIQSEGGQIIMTSDRPPGEIAKLEARLKSRFGAGLIVEIGQPDWELRTAILLIKAKQSGIDLSMEMAQLIAEKIEGVRELDGFLARLSVENNGKTYEEKVRDLLQIDDNRSNSSRMVIPIDVFNSVGNYYGVGVQLLKGDKRTKTIAWPRQILMYFLCAELKLPLEEVGRLVGGRDHTTVMHARDKVIAELAGNQKFKMEYFELKKKILQSGS